MAYFPFHAPTPIEALLPEDEFTFGSAARPAAHLPPSAHLPSSAHLPLPDDSPHGSRPWPWSLQPTATAPRQARVRALDRLREALVLRHYSPHTERAYVAWVARFLLRLRDTPPPDLTPDQVLGFLSHIATNGHVSASTQNQAASALVFFFRHVLEQDLPGLDCIVRARRPPRVPQVLTRAEVDALLGHLTGDAWLMASLMYGSGLRLSECCRLRVRDLDFPQGQVVVRSGKGDKDRVTPLANRLADPLRRHLDRVRRLHLEDLREGMGRVALPSALDRAMPDAARKWGWQWVFPAPRLHLDRVCGERRRHPLSGSFVERAFKQALAAAGIPKPATCHSLRHSFASQMLADGCNIRTVQELLGHSDVGTTLIYTHVLGPDGDAVRSPLDRTAKATGAGGASRAPSPSETNGDGDGE